jgi:tetratricopeptide (TPR) repeat protein
MLATIATVFLTLHAAAEPAALATKSPYAIEVAMVADGYQLIERGDREESLGRVNEAIQAYRQAAALFHKRRVRSGEATALHRAGVVLQEQGRLPEAYRSLRQAANLFGHASWRGPQAQALLAFGTVAEALGREAEARRAYDKAARLFLRVHDRSQRGESLIRLGRAIALHDGLQRGRPYLERAILEAREREDVPRIMKAKLAMGDALLQEEALADALEMYEQVLRLADRLGDMRVRALVRTRIVRIYMQTNRTAEGFPLVRTALTLYQSLRDRQGEADTLSLMGNMQLAEGEPDQAALSHEQAGELYRALQNLPREAASLINHGIAFEIAGHVTEAESARSKAIALLQAQAP